MGGTTSAFGRSVRNIRRTTSLCKNVQVRIRNDKDAIFGAYNWRTGGTGTPKEWPTPQKVTKFKSFLGFCTYYRKFVKGFSQLTTPLTNFTKKGDFDWLGVAQDTSEQMKQVMSTCTVLALANLTRPFVLECDALGIGIATFLMQNNHPISFESGKLKDYKWHYSIYDKEMLAIMHALAKFRKYLVGNKFKSKTNHNNLKFLMEQKELS
jgi:hypothetical protein